MPILTDQEADELDELLTKIVPKTNPNKQGPFIRRQAGYKGRTAADIADDMERIVANIEHGRAEV
jgi:hypothetical protein